GCARSRHLRPPAGGGAPAAHDAAPTAPPRWGSSAPPYLYRGRRPTINPAVGSFRRGGSYPISFTSEDGTLRVAILIRPAAVTHSSDPNQREIRVPVQVTSPGRVTLTMPANGNIAPIGYYLLVLLDRQGPPPVTRF